MTRGRAARGAICHKKPSGVKLCRMATATEVVNGAIIVAPPIAPATNSATAFRRPIASRANQRQHRARAELHRRADFRGRRAEHDAGSGRHDHRQQRRDRRQIRKTQSASEAPVDIAQFAQHMRQTEQRQRRRIGGERRHRRESREGKDRRHAERDRGADIHQRTRLHDGAWRARRINAAAERALADRAAPACPTASRTLPAAGAAAEAVRGGGIDPAARYRRARRPRPRRAQVPRSKRRNDVCLSWAVLTLRASAANRLEAAQIWDGLATIARPGRRGSEARVKSPVRAACKAPRKIAMVGA